MLLRLIAFASAALLLGGNVATPSPVPTRASAEGVIATISSRYAGLKAYTFDISLHIALLTFPWIRFRLNGHGEYQRDGSHFVHFDHMPWFGKGWETIKLDALDLDTWPKSYTMTVVEQEGGRSVLSMHDRKKSPLTEARATLDNSGVREAIWLYDYGGHVRLTVVPTTVSGFALPSTEEAEIVMPRYRAMAWAEFSNYHVTADPPNDPK